MIFCDESKFHVGRVTGRVLLVAVSILPLSVAVRAEDESDQQRAEQVLESTRAFVRKSIESWKRKDAIDGAAQELRNLGFDDELIEALMKDHAKAKSATQILENILRLTDKDREEARPDNANTLRMPLHPLAPDEQAKLRQYFNDVKGLEDAATQKGEAGAK